MRQKNSSSEPQESLSIDLNAEVTKWANLKQDEIKSLKTSKDIERNLWVMCLTN
jgi:hypothetical protein